MSPEATPKPPVSARDVSFQQALAGGEAQRAAAATGGDPADLRALAQSVKAQPVTIRGQELHGFSLQVILDLQLVTVVTGFNPLEQLPDLVSRLAANHAVLPTPAELRAIALLGWIFTDPLGAFDLLDDASRAEDPAARADLVRELERTACAVVGSWDMQEIGSLFAHIVRLGKSVPAAAATPS